MKTLLNIQQEAQDYVTKVTECVRDELKIGSKDSRLIIEAFRRKHILKDENRLWVGLGVPSLYKSKLFSPAHYPEQKRSLNWYKLTELGIEKMAQLEKRVLPLPKDHLVVHVINEKLFIL